MNDHKKSIKLEYILFFIFLFSFAKSDLNFVEINLDNGDFSQTYNDQNEVKKFKIKSNQSPYLEIAVKGKNGRINNHIISYYQKEDLEERKQLSQSIKDTTIMWLTQGQIKKDFYITVECAKKESCSFEMKINKKEKAELYLNEQYTYYITDENKEMDFILKNSLIEYEENNRYYVAVWVKSNKKIETKIISGGKNENHSCETFSYYRVEFDDNFINSKYVLKIKGEIGNLINVGLIFFRECVDNHCSAQLRLEDGEEVSGYISNGLSHSFGYNDLDKSKFPLGEYYDFNNIHMRKGYTLRRDYYSQERSYFIDSKDDDIFYSLQHINNTLYQGLGNNKYSPLLHGVYYNKDFHHSTTIGLIPMKLEDNFNYLTYEVIPSIGTISVSIAECNNYPLCDINEIKSKKIDNYRNYYYTTYSRKEWGKDISPISKKQNMLLITCENGINNNILDNICSAYINMKTDKKAINYTDFTLKQPPYQRFIKKDNEDKYFLKPSKNPIHLYIEKITGDFSIVINGKDNKYKEYSKGNKNFFIIPENIDVNIKIKAKENSFYSINANFNNKKEYFSIGYNYLLNIENDIELKIGEYDEEEDDEEFYNETLYKNAKEDKDANDNPNDNLYDEEDILDYFIGIYPINCDIKVQVLLNNEIYDQKDIKEDNFYQNILTEYRDYKFKLIKKESKSSEKCLFYLTSYFKNIYNYNNYITLLNGISFTIDFKKENKLMKFSFPHTNLENDIKIDFNIIKEGKYKAKIKINEESIDEQINESKEIKFKANDIKQKCKDFKSICYILLDIEAEDSQKESELKITLISEEEDDDDDDKKLIIILSIIGVVIIAIIVGLIIYIIKTYKRNQGLNKAVNQISFKEDNDNDNNEGIVDTLLD